MIAVDTNLLVYANRQDSPWHTAARACLRPLIEGSAPWALPWSCVHEFLAVVTHPKIYRPPTALDRALAQVAAILASPSVVLLAESDGYFPVLDRLLSASRAVGPRIHDARIAAVCLHHGIDEIWTADRHFADFGGIKVKNPLRAAPLRAPSLRTTVE